MNTTINVHKHMVMNVSKSTERKTRTYAFDRYGNNYVEPGQALSEILWNAFGPGKATSVWVEYRDNFIRIFNDGKPVDLNDVFQYGISTRSSALSSFGTGTTNAASFFNPSNTCFGMNAKTANGYMGIRAPFGETMVVGEINDEEIKLMRKVSPNVVTEFFAYDENSVLSEFDFMNRLGRICALQIKCGKHIYFNDEPVAPIIYDCGSLGKRAPKWDKEELVRTESGNFVLQYSQIDATDDPAKSQDTQGVWLYFNNMLLEHRGVRMFKSLGRKTKNEKLVPHNQYNNIRTIVNIVTENVENALDMPFNNTKTGVQWNAKAARVICEVIDSRTGEIYRRTKEFNSEAGKRKCVDYICKKMFWCVDDLVKYDTEVKLAPFGLTCDAMIYSGDTFSWDNVRSGKTVVHGIVEFKKSTLNCTHAGQAVGYLLSAIPCDSEHPLPRVIFVGRHVSKNIDQMLNNIGGHLRQNLEYNFIDYANVSKLWDDVAM